MMTSGKISPKFPFSLKFGILIALLAVVAFLDLFFGLTFIFFFSPNLLFKLPVLEALAVLAELAELPLLNLRPSSSSSSPSSSCSESGRSKYDSTLALFFIAMYRA